ncbi:ABC transporter substrate-binding protein [Asticcacaulis sp. ZE23SCel15]|uniref:ABC transporter substrate-binding protein n=1 Tax=Asticcacaulis sp. ZE23SCel15 TaxID=3059027 RepID=UPI00265DF8F0|nr:ABC transporter substrate-binding protein [Asticcacaulis sp. ZE23SCel15]WKL56739.1 ABC transporter substrate-binding protein [Asticcacaulis sp. ZE23SCel15]
MSTTMFRALPRRTLLTGLIGITAALAACGEKPASAPAAKLPETVTIAAISYTYQGKPTFNGLSQVVINQGWLEGELKKKGVALNWLPVPTSVGGPLINEGFAAKRIDFAGYGDFPALIAKSGGVDIRAITSSGQGNNAYLIVRKGLEAKSIEDLKGKSLAIHRGRPWELTLAKLLDSKGLKLTDFKIYNLNPQAAYSALAAGKVDAVFTLSEAILQEDKGAGTIIWSTKSNPEWKMRTGLFARTEFTTQNPELTQLVVNAYIKAAHWASQPENRAAFLELASRGNNPTSVLERDYANEGGDWNDHFSPIIDQGFINHFDDVSKYTFENKLVQKEVASRDFIDPTFVNQGIDELGLTGFWKETPVTGPVQ